MRQVSYQLLHTRDVTYVLIVTPEDVRAVHDYEIVLMKRGTHLYEIYRDTVTKAELFPGKCFEYACRFEGRYALVVTRGKYHHIDGRGTAVYRWRFTDVGKMRSDDTVWVQHPRAVGWSLFHVPSSSFVFNPPR